MFSESGLGVVMLPISRNPIQRFSNSLYCTVDAVLLILYKGNCTRKVQATLRIVFVIMKLHLSRKLRAALLAAMSASSAMGVSIPYTGTIYTWEGTNGNFHQGALYATTQNEDGSFSVSETATGNWNRDFCAVSSAGGNDTNLTTANTLRFAAGAAFATVNYSFTPLAVGGFIIESDTDVRQMSGGNRVIRFGNSSDVEAYSTIKADFTLSGGTSTTYLRGTQQWSVEGGSTFTLASPSQVEKSLSLMGEGTVAFSNTLTVNNDASLSLSDSGILRISSAIINNGTLNMAGSVDLVGVSGIPAATAPAAGTNGFASREAFSLTVVSGAGTINGADSVNWKVQGDDLSVGSVTFNNGELQVAAEDTTIYYVQADDSIIVRSETSLPTASGFVITSSGNTLTLKDVDIQNLYNGIALNASGENTLVIDTGSSLSAADINRTGGVLHASILGDFSIIGAAVKVNGDMNIDPGGTVTITAADAFGYRGVDYTDSVRMQGSESAPAVLNIGKRQTMTTPLEMNGYASIADAENATTSGDQVAGFESFGYSIIATGTENEIATRLMGRGGNDVEINVVGEEDELLISGILLARPGQDDSDYIKTGQGTLILSNEGNVLTRLYEHRSGTTRISGKTVMQQGLSLADGTVSVTENGELVSEVGLNTAGSLLVDGLLTVGGGASELAQLSGSGLLNASGNEVSLRSSTEIGAILADTVTMTGAEGERNLMLTSTTTNTELGTLSAVETLTIGPSASLTVTDTLTVNQIELKVNSLTPLLSVGTLQSESDSIGINAAVSDAVLLGMGNGDTLTLANVTDNNSNLSLTVNGGNSYELTNDSGFSYIYTLEETGTRGVTLLLTANRNALGWIGESGDMWADGSAAEWAGTPPSATSPARFFGDGTGSVLVDAAGVNAQQVLVSADGSTTAYTLNGGSVNTSVLAVSEGALTIANVVEVRRNTDFSGTSGLVVVGDSGTLRIASGASLLAETELQVQGKGVLSNAGILRTARLNGADTVVQNSGTLTVASGNIAGLSGGNLVIDDVAESSAGTLTVTSSVNLNKLSGTGALDVGEHEVTLSSASGSVGVTADSLTVLSEGITLGDLQVNTLLLGGDIVLNSEVAPVQVSSMNSGTLRVTDAVFASIPTTADGLYTSGDYILLSGAGSGVSFDDESRLQAVRRVGLSAGSVSENNELILRIAESESPMIWNTSDGNRVASNGYIVPSLAGFYKALDYVESVIVPGETVFDLAAPEVGDAVAGNATVPEAGLFIRNLQGGGLLSISGNGTEADKVTLIATEENASPASLSVSRLRLNVGLPDEVKGILPDDHSRLPIVLRNLRLENNSFADVSAGLSLEVGTLTGDESSRINGSISLTGNGSVYRGSYGEVEMRALPGSSQLLVPGSGLSLSAQQSATSLDFGTADARMQQLSVHTAQLTLLNTGTDENGGITHHTLRLAEPSSIEDSAVTLSLGVYETAGTLGRSTAPVVLSGPVSISGSSITVDMVQDSVPLSNYLPVNTAATEDLVLARLVEGGDVQNNSLELRSNSTVQPLLDKYYTNARLANDGTIRVDRVAQYYSDRIQSSGSMEQQGLQMMDKTLLYLNPQANPEQYPDLTALLDTLDATVAYDSPGTANLLAAAVTGSSAAAMSAAVAGDMERQLRTIRNRVADMGTNPNPCEGDNPELPAFHAWVNAEGNHARLNRSGMEPGYSLSSWGGTLGLAVDCSPCLTSGLAFSYMHGDFDSKAADSADGNLDFYYMNAFARYSTMNWSHTFIATLGIADTELSRHYASFNTSGKTDGLGFGFLYELSYQYLLNEQQDVILQPLVNVAFRHTSLEGYSERGSDAGLHFGDSDVTAVTFGLGARFVGSAGETLYNRQSRVEGRALLKFNAGDRAADISSSLLALPAVGAHVRSAEMGVLGAEIGAGITVPIGVDSGSMFIDASLEFSSDYTEFNGIIGYQIDF